MSKISIERAKAGQVFFGLSEYSGTPIATVNGGAPVTLTAVPSGVVLSVPVAQDDSVSITFDPVL